jgi:hypothetical protein
MLSAQRALLGNVGPSLLGACIEARGETVRVTWYVTADITVEEAEDLWSAGGQIAGDLPNHMRYEERTVEVTDRSRPLPTAGLWVFLQRELTTTEAADIANPSSTEARRADRERRLDQPSR